MDDTETPLDSTTTRILGLVAGAMTQIVFAATVWFLFSFLRFGVGSSDSPWLLVDTALALQFAIVHSILLHPSTKRRLTRYVRPEFYGCLFCFATCVGLGLVFFFWRGSQGVAWQATGSSARWINGCFYASWIGLFYSLYLSGLGYQTGLTPWWHWVMRQPQPRRRFVPSSLYRWLRHPIYLSFLGLIWFTGRMSWDHALLTGLWTIYIFIGSYLKDERLAFYMGDSYRVYQATVPGYPLMLFGPLARRAYVARPTTVEPLNDDSNVRPAA